MADKTSRLLNKIAKTTEQVTPIATDMILPNHSGTHDAGIIRNTPVNPTDIVNKAYVDGLSSGLWETDGSTTSLISPTDIDAITKKIINVVDPSADQHAATKKYVDDNDVDGLWEVSGGNTQLITADDILIDTDYKIQFRDSGLYIQSSADGVLGVYSDSDLFLNGLTLTTIGVTGDTLIGDGTTNYSKVNSTGNQTFHGSAGFYPRTVSQDAIPTAGTGSTQIDSGEMVFWIDTNDGDKCWLLYNDGGDIHKKEMDAV